MTTTGVASPEIAPSTGREDLVTVAGAAVMIIGLFLDGYAHQNLIESDESFLTIYHAVFYSGFAASSAAVYRAGRVRAPDS